jgi:murein DD-endopeptidase MepM/ murein hydrolase activator NlpD
MRYLLIILSLFLLAADFASIRETDRLLLTDLSGYPGIWPVRDENGQVVVTSGFGPRWGRLHQGCDIEVNVGTPVCAMGAGTVIVAGPESGYGNMVATLNGNVELRYGHLSVISVKVWDKVKRGDRLGLSGNSGRTTGPHLHCEIRINGCAVDPKQYIVR